MVATRNRNDISSKFRNYNKTQDLNDWIKNVKNKKIVKKKQTRGQDLRVLAILTRALVQAEDDLRKKQEERAMKWAQIRMRLNEPITNNHLSEDDTEVEKEKEKITNLWNCELNGIDNLINDLNQIKSQVVR
uniref:Uncharacterized protein n=1 Tax=Corethrella appendiculata TaxID=1370023 RepID=U5EP97_9DIPT